MSREGPSEAADQADPDSVAQRPASNLLLAGTGLSLALAVGAVVGLSNDDTVPAPPAARESPVQPAPVSLAAREPGPPADSSGSWYLTPAALATSDTDPLGMAPLPMDLISDGQLNVDEMPFPSVDKTPPAATSSRSPLLAPRVAKALPSAASWTSQPGLDNPSSPSAATFQANSADAATSAFGEGRDAPDAAGGASDAGAPSAAHGGSSGGAAGGGGSNPPGGDSHSGKPGGPGGDGPGDSDGPGGPGGPGGGPGGPGGPGGGPGGPGGGPGGGGPGGGPGGDGPGGGGPGGGGHGGHGGQHSH